MGRNVEEARFYEEKFKSEVFRRSILIACAIRGLCPMDITEKLGLTSNSMARWMCGYHKPRFETVERIAKTLRVPTGFVLGMYSFGYKNGKRYVELKGE